MFTKEFESAIRFKAISNLAGSIDAYPLVPVNLIQADGKKIGLSLLFDTGASITSLRYDLYPLLGLSSWDVGILSHTQTAGGVNPIEVYRYEGITLEVFGKSIICPVNLIKMPPHPLFSGLLGRETIFENFGFGFWERTRELFVTLNP
ncbi:MAG TPA: retropepsin-like aspartic protease [Syntrophales bacterium]|nr:retropepsin-like aspartic protease [Syntrophales bacterium]HQN78002.1 retropepsin-like aspartic protease [Syntrophales bacterium]HQQ26826.1 retropepsin-like aspartic protease [Syntrophales bacterium]